MSLIDHLINHPPLASQRDLPLSMLLVNLYSHVHSVTLHEEIFTKDLCSDRTHCFSPGAAVPPP